MKIKNFIILSAILLLTFACKKDDKTAAVVTTPTTPTTTPVTKELFSTGWSVSNNAWELNWGAGNLTGAPFTSYVTYSGGGTCSCTTTITGTQTAGSYQTDCSVQVAHSGVPTTGDCNGLDYVAGGRYTNDTAILTLCRSAGTGNCTLIYH